MFDTTYQIPTGTLTLRTTHDPAWLLDVQARNNPKRGFLFVSKVLGKHLPVDPNAMRETYAQLVDQLPQMDGEVLVIGMAETATQLGYGVWREWEQRNANSYFLHTTRYKTCTDALGFEESHSHAPSQWIQGLNNPCLRNVAHVVLVDDELSTGKTFHALQHVVQQALPQVQNVHWVCLTDFRPPMHRTYPAVSLMSGEWAFEWSTVPKNVALSEGAVVPAERVPFDFGRLVPVTSARRTALLERGRAYLEEELSWRGLGNTVLVLGTGEFMPYAFEMAEVLEGMGKQVRFQATTRSPAMMPRVHLGEDHYGEGVAQYVYNVQRNLYDSVVVVAESNCNGRLEHISQALQAHVINVQKLSFEESVRIS